MDKCPTILFGGDCHFGDKPVRLDRHLRGRFGKAEFLIVNQESPITEVERPTAEKAIHLRSSIGAVNWLQDLGVRVVSLANNHIADYGEQALQETIRRLKSANIAPVGAGTDLSAANTPAYVECPDGQTIAFLAFTSRSIESKIAEDCCYGCAELEPGAVERAIERAREKASHTVLLLHYGLTNYEYPTPKDRELVRSFARHGVDLIIGHHPHVFQGYEMVDGVPVFYSLGNLIFASYYKRRRIVPLGAGNRIGVLVAVGFSAQGVRINDIIFTETTESADHLSLTVAQDSTIWARSFEVRSRRLKHSSYEIFFRRYAVRRIFHRLLLWTSPRRWPTFSGAQLQSLWLSVSHVLGRRE